MKTFDLDIEDRPCYHLGMSTPAQVRAKTGNQSLKRRKPSSADVAARAGVSRSTVSVVLNGHREPIIAQATRERVLQAAQALNYRPNQLARALITGSSRLIGLWMWSLPSPYDVSFIQNTLGLLRADQYQALLFEMTPGREAEKLMDPSQWPIEGIITEIKPEFIQQFLTEHPDAPPIVTIGAEVSELTDFVRFDIGSGVREALKHLMDTGRRRIALITSADSDLNNEDRALAYRCFMEAAGEEPEIIPCEFVDRSRESVMQAVREHLATHGRPEAILCYNDEIAIAVNRQLRESGIAVPGDIAIVGCDGWQETEYQVPQLSTIRLPLEQACRIAWGFLQNRIADPDYPRQQITLPTHLVIRGSSS
jgi:DNA-binding LacI/PurR family transcriptional regulator